MSGAFDVTFCNLKLTHTTAHHGVRREVRLAADLPPKIEPVFTPTQIPAFLLLLCMPVLACGLLAWSIYRHLPYAGSVLHLAVLELAPTALVACEAPGTHSHVAVLSLAACYALFASTTPFQQHYMNGAVYVTVVLVLVLQVMTVLKYRPVDALLAASTAVAILSAVLLRLLAPLRVLVQTAETALLLLCLGAYLFMLPRTLPPR
jgi:hypothetical protein